MFEKKREPGHELKCDFDYERGRGVCEHIFHGKGEQETPIVISKLDIDLSSGRPRLRNFRFFGNSPEEARNEGEKMREFAQTWIRLNIKKIQERGIPITETNVESEGD